MRQHRKQRTQYTDLICMALSCEVCINQRVTPIDPRLTLQREITFVNVRAVCTLEIFYMLFRYLRNILTIQGKDLKMSRSGHP